MDDTQALTKLNLQFIEAFRRGSWELLEPILSPSFSYLDGATGEVWANERYVDNLRENPAPSLVIDQVAVHVDGDTAVVSARTSGTPGRYSRYVDTYERREDGWLCVHACVWPLQETGRGTPGQPPLPALRANPASALGNRAAKSRSATQISGIAELVRQRTGHRESGRVTR
jgi:hypothetical protein